MSKQKSELKSNDIENVSGGVGEQTEMEVRKQIAQERGLGRYDPSIQMLLDKDQSDTEQVVSTPIKRRRRRS